jgi:hypothetical protein
MIQIGTPVESLKEARATILAILASTCEEATKREALLTLREVSHLNASFTGCNFTGNP